MIILCVKHGEGWFISFTSLVFYLLPTFGCKTDVRWGGVRIRLADCIARMTDNVSAYKIHVAKHQGK